MIADEDLVRGIFRLCEETGRSCTIMKGQVTIHYQGQKEFKSKNLDEVFLGMAEIWTKMHAPKPKLESREDDADVLLAMAKGHEALIAHNKRKGEREDQP